MVCVNKSKNVVILVFKFDDAKVQTFFQINKFYIKKIVKYLIFVGTVGFEPTQPNGNRFTVCPDSPTSAHPHLFDSTVGFAPTNIGFADQPINYSSKWR